MKALAILAVGLALGGVAQAQDRLTDAKAKVAAVEARAKLIEELAGMGEVDREVRMAFLNVRKDATPEERVVLDREVGAMINAVDKRHVARLRVILASHEGWFPVSQYGARAAGAAETLVNHSGDLALMKEALARMAPLVGTSELTAGYANLYDRTAVMDGRLQRYGTQDAACVGGVYGVPTNVEDPAGLEARRAALKLQPMKDYLQTMTQMYGRCDGKPGGRS